MIALSGWLIFCLAVTVSAQRGGVHDNFNQFVPPQAPREMNIMEGAIPEAQADYYNNFPDQPDYQTQYDQYEYEAPDQPDQPDLPDAPDMPDYPEAGGPGVFFNGGAFGAGGGFGGGGDIGDVNEAGDYGDGGFGFLGGDWPLGMTGGKAPNAVNGDATGGNSPRKAASSSASSVGIAFAVLAIVGLAIGGTVFLVRRYKHRIPVIPLK